MIQFTYQLFVALMLLMLFVIARYHKAGIFVGIIAVYAVICWITGYDYTIFEIDLGAFTFAISVDMLIFMMACGVSFLGLFYDILKSAVERR